MPISQLTTRCWVLRPEPVLHDGDEHFTSAADAQRRAKDADLTGEPEQLPAPCWTIRCDGECDTMLDEEGDCYTVHSASRADAEQYATGFGWILTEDGEVFCGYDDEAGSPDA